MPHGSVLRRLLFIVYTQSFVSQIFQTISLQMMQSFTNQVFLPTFQFLPVILKDCIEDVAEWTSDSKLKMTDDKTELLAVDTRS